MTRFVSEEAALEAGFRIVHEAANERFVLLDETDTVRGIAHYRRFAPDGVNFDHTVVDESLRGTGLSGVLARHALGHELVRGRPVKASCWFMAGLIRRDPGVLADGATYLG
ncbi:GNAT family N-acetyltransferase [Leucobacter chinensis]|uniref:GNAT family N-acetyltransferase n=1 Tax=Leucobacter chinensis TaxID=2851010 RepID=UPI001C24D6F9|nr:GNAT family N-acetyltransferase [Leucobacter chinensis]